MTIQTSDENQYNLCVNWLMKQKMTKSINKNSTTYYYKHVVERETGYYIKEINFINAADSLNFKRNENNCLSISKNLV